jgi:plastocyanin
MHDDTFEPATIEVTAGSPSEFELTNAGQTNHNFTSTDLGVSTGPMQPGDVSTLTVAVPTGTTQFVCTWHPGMTISVVGS